MSNLSSAEREAMDGIPRPPDAPRSENMLPYLARVGDDVPGRDAALVETLLKAEALLAEVIALLEPINRRHNPRVALTSAATSVCAMLWDADARPRLDAARALREREKDEP